MKSFFAPTSSTTISKARIWKLRVISVAVIALGVIMLGSSASARFAIAKFVNKAVVAVHGAAKPKPAPAKRSGSVTVPTSPAVKKLSPVSASLVPQSAEATVSTDKLHYEPGETVLITGSGFSANERVTLQVRHHDRRVEVGPAYDPWDVYANGNGGISSSWVVDPQETHQSWLEVRAKGADSGLFTMVFFTDPASADLDQCGNGPASVPVPCTLDAWQNGNLNENQAHYREGDSVPYRMKFDQLVIGGSNTVTISYDTTKNGKHALDYLTDYDRTESVGNNPCSGIAGCTLASESTFPIPVDSRVTNGENQVPGGGDDIVQIPGSFSLFGGTITGVSSYTVSGSYAGDSTTSVTVTFTSNVTNPVLAWGGHIATRIDWGTSNSAIAISGSPYHMRLEDLNGSGGNQDRSLSAGAVFFPISVTIVKVTDPDDAQTKTFNYTTTGTDLSAFSLTPPNGITSDSKNFILNDDSTRTVTESDPHASSPEFNLTNIACVQTDGGLGVGTFSTSIPNRSLSFKPNEGQSLTCTFTNAEDLNATRGKIIVDKVTNPGGDTQSFNFTPSYGSPFNLTDAATPNDSGLIMPGTYSVSETANSAYVTTATCTSSLGQPADDPSAIHLAAGETVTCTFTNAKKPKLTVTKIVVNNNGGTKQVSDFPLFVDSNSVTSGVKNTSTVGAHTVSETTDSGYAATIGGDCAADGSITLAAGDDKACTITNDDKAAKLIVIKHVINDNGGTATAANFTLDSGGTNDSPDNFSGAESPGTEVTLDAGSYNVTESGPSGYTASYSADCSGTIANGQTKTCTVTNDDKAAKLIVIKHVINNNGGTATAANFTLDSGGANDSPDNFAGAESPGTEVTLDAGSYNVTESGPSGYTASFSADCSGSIANGQTKTCTVTNDDQAAKLIVIKHVINDNGGTATAANFTLDSGGTNDSPDDFAGAESPGTQVTLDAGSYNVTESGPAGYAASFSAYCSGTIANGQTKTCTVTNNDISPTLRVIKDVAPDTDGGLFNLRIDGATAGTGANVGDGGTTGFVPVNAGNHTVSETAGTNTTLSDYTTVIGGDCAANGTVSLALAQNKTCTITNTKKGMAQIVKTVSGLPPAAGQTFTFEIRQGASTVSDGTVLESNTTDASGNLNFTTKLVAGQTYQMCEWVFPGWNTNLVGDGPLFVPNSLIPPALPNPNVNNLTVCTNFSVQPGQTRTFTVNNTPPPGGRALTIGFWKNWASCASSNGKGQKPMLDLALGIASATTTNPPGGLVASAQNPGALWPNYAATWYLIIKGNPASTANNIRPAPDCTIAENLLDKTTTDGKKKMSSDPLFNMTAQLIAAQLNRFMGAGINGTTIMNIDRAVLLNGKYKFNGLTYTPKLTTADANLANCLATQLDNYNNGRPVGLCP
jgi:hypothetical protein